MNYYVYILYSSKSDGFYFGSTPDIINRIKRHNGGKVQSTKPYLPWRLVWFAGFESRRMAENFEHYLKSGSGKAFAYKRLIQSEISRKMAGKGSPQP